ncbi:hypothetical protein [Mycolicibacterium goodii]|uniref:hypothetical protein n=1 Tax=Mycolicibacterium goodii TaxID=134601 RepID=UPI00256F1CA1|nr:hypothetical protein [Mycolicibacterium goodii]
MAHPKPGNDTPGTVTPGSRNSTTPRDLPRAHKTRVETVLDRVISEEAGVLERLKDA